MSHDKPGAAEHSSVDWDVLFNPTQSSSGPSPRLLYTCSISFSF